MTHWGLATGRRPGPLPQRAQGGRQAPGQRRQIPVCNRPQAHSDDDDGDGTKTENLLRTEAVLTSCIGTRFLNAQEASALPPQRQQRGEALGRRLALRSRGNPLA